MLTMLRADDGKFELSLSGAVARRLLLETLDDIGKEIEDIARANAPGSLSVTGVERFGAGGLDPGVAAFGGGFSFRGGDPRNRGRFSKRPSALEFQDDRVVSVVQVPEEPEHARWVHGGTGIYGPHASPIVPVRGNFMWFHAYGRKWKLASVKGQPAQPYLDEAQEIVRSTYVPMRIARLRAAIKAVT